MSPVDEMVDLHKSELDDAAIELENDREDPAYFWKEMRDFCTQRAARAAEKAFNKRGQRGAT